MTNPPDAPQPNGPAYAAILAAALGCAAFALFIDLAENIKSVGNLSGKTTLGILVWLLAWLFLHLRWKNRHLTATGAIACVSLLLILLSLVASFPPVLSSL